MCRLIETIKIKNRELQNLYYHNLRFNKARKDVFNSIQFIDLAKTIKIPSDFNNQIYKCRVLYTSEIENIEYSSYSLPNINNLKLIYDDNIEYFHKFEGIFIVFARSIN